MTKLQFVISFAVGQISTAIAMIKMRPQSPKRDRIIKALKVASAALAEVITSESEEDNVFTG